MTAPDTALATLFDDVLEAASPFEGTGLDRDLWQRLSDLGLTTITSAQGGTWADAVTALRATAGHGAQVPLAEHDLLANWLRQHAGLPLSEQPSVVMATNEHSPMDRVAWRDHADHIVVLQVSNQGATVCEGAAAVSVDPGLTGEYRLRGALARSAQISGAMTAAVDMTIRYAGERIQFGRPIAGLQAVQHLVADALAETALALTAVDAAAASADRDGVTAPGTVAAIAAAKSVSSRSATVVVRNTHQVHGAIGTTAEHPLHRRTASMLSWRNDFGSAVEWETVIADELVQPGRTVWSWLSGW
ncbi:hypothetical protein BCA37_18965 [Mycobacterium sp. djl-10]|nr:hypothetical protein BCA37_18965 [Mycobacterium sp. djl-10]